MKKGHSSVFYLSIKFARFCVSVFLPTKPVNSSEDFPAQIDLSVKKILFALALLGNAYKWLNVINFA